jgi:hypothetical protein
MAKNHPRRVHVDHALLARCLWEIDKHVDSDLLLGNTSSWSWHYDEDDAWKALDGVLEAARQALDVVAHLPASTLTDEARVVLKQVHHLLSKAQSSRAVGPNLTVTIEHAFRTIHHGHGAEIRRLAAQLENAGDKAPQADATKQAEVMDEATKVGHNRLLGDTCTVFGFTVYWRNATSRLRSIPRWKKRIAILVILLALLLVLMTRSAWLPLVLSCVGE